MFRTRYVQQPKEELRWLIAALIVALLGIVLLSRVAAGVSIKPEGPAQIVAVTSPWYGLFSAGEYPGAPPYVRVGDRVGPGTIVGRIDTVCHGEPGTGLTVLAGVEGVVAQILVVDGEQVSVGQTLLTIQVEPKSPPIAGR